MTAAATLGEVERHQRYALAAQLCANGRVLALGIPEDARQDQAPQMLADAAAAFDCADVTQFLGDPADDDHDSVVCLDVVHGVEPEEMLERLGGCADAGKQVLLAVAGSAGPQVTHRLSTATVIQQHAVEMAWLCGPLTEDELRVRAPDVDARAARWTIFAYGFDPEAVAAACGLLGAGASPVHYGFLTALEASHAELRRTNARLEATPDAKQGAAAAAVRAPLEARIRQLEDRVEWHEQRLAQEVENARRNDEMLRHARAALQTPRHRAVESLRYHLLRVPLAGRALQLIWRLIGRAFRR